MVAAGIPEKVAMGLAGTRRDPSLIAITSSVKMIWRKQVIASSANLERQAEAADVVPIRHRADTVAVRADDF